MQVAQESDDDGLGAFLQVQPGDLLHDHRYEILRPLGSGLYSSVWLVRDTKCGIYRALKILRTGCYGGQESIFEREILCHLRDKNPQHPGYAHIPRLCDTFDHDGPDGTHVCLVLELMIETFTTFPTVFKTQEIPKFMVKRFVKQLLLALDYAHQSGVIHTDIKPNNIMIKVEDLSAVDEYLKATAANPLGSDEHIRNYFLPVYSEPENLSVALCDWGSASWTDKHLTELIQPQLLRAPEVMLGASWGPKVDVWNLGAVIPEFHDAVRMFYGEMEITGWRYQLKHHLEEIDTLLGPFPPRLLEKADQDTVNQYFDKINGQWILREPTPRPPGAHLGLWVQPVEGTEKENLLAVLRSMLVIDPDQRKSAAELLNEPWLSEG